MTTQRKKTFDCIEMKRRAQERIYAETKDLSPQEEIEYYRKRAEPFWRAFRERKESSPSKTVGDLE